MGTIVVTTNTTLDGVVQDPDGKEGLPFGGWFSQFGGRDLGAWAELETDEALRAARGMGARGGLASTRPECS